MGSGRALGVEAAGLVSQLSNHSMVWYAFAALHGTQLTLYERQPFVES